jgi:hypothetical protein
MCVHNGNARAPEGAGHMRNTSHAGQRCGWAMACVKLLEDGFVVDSHMGDRRGPS